MEIKVLRERQKKPRFLKDHPSTLTLYIHEDEGRIVPQWARLTIYRPRGQEKLIDSADMTIAQDGLLSYELTAADNSQTGENYRAVVEYSNGTYTGAVILFYDVVLNRPAIVVTHEDLVAELPQLSEGGWRHTGTAEDGSTTTIVDGALKGYPEGYFTGGMAHLVDRDETVKILGFDPESGTVTTEPLGSSVTSGERYILIRTFEREIERAFEKLEDRLLRAGIKPHLVMDPVDVRELHLYLSVAEVCKGLSSGKDDFWWHLWKEYERGAERLFETTTLKYDRSRNGYISGSEEVTRINIIKAVRE